ncbi:MAG TPA: NAD(P)H-binding protein [Actinocatenispora sp.]
MIVLTTPTGTIGRQVLGHVLAAGEPVRLIVRDPAKLPADVRDRVEVVAGSHGDPHVADRALDGADTLFWLPPPNHHAAHLDDAFVGFTRPVLGAIGRVKRVVSVSAAGRGTAYADRAGHVTASLAMDDLIAGTGVALRALAMPSFMDNLLRQAGLIAQQGMFVDVVDPDRRRPTVATRDIAAVAARLLLDPAWTDQREIPVLGPEDLSYDEMAAIATEVLGTPVRYQRIPGETFARRLADAGTSAAMTQALLDMMTAKDHGLDDGVTRTPRHAADTPTTFRQWCEDTLKPAVRAA